MATLDAKLQELCAVRKAAYVEYQRAMGTLCTGEHQRAMIAAFNKADDDVNAYIRKVWRREINSFVSGEGTAESHADFLGVTVDDFMAEVEKQNQRLANAHAALAVSNAGSVK